MAVIPMNPGLEPERDEAGNGDTGMPSASCEGTFEQCAGRDPCTRTGTCAKQ
jgi:hypothetical protein